MTSRGRKGSVTIFGAGVAGLTAAHELVERGFHVEVIDPDIEENIHNFTLDRGLGGMARSQWGCRLDGVPALRTEEKAPQRVETGTDFLVSDVIVFDAATKEPLDWHQSDELFDRATNLIERLVKGAAGSKPDPKRASELTVALPVNDLKGAKGGYREAYVLRVLKPKLAAKGLGAALQHINFQPTDAESMSVKGHSSPDDTWLFFHLPNLQIFPSEHGFRFFPSFYRHIFDSLRRTPIRYPHDHERTHPTVRENLLPSERLGFGRAGKAKAFAIPRRPILSMEQARTYLREILTELGYQLSDINRFGMKLLEYMTSCTERRASDYENISWGTFVEQEKYSRISREHLEYGPQMAAALRGSKSDARTQGTILLQLHMDQLQSGGTPDCTLNGPTSSAWLNHWQDYLLEQGVEFKRGTLVDFKQVKGEVVPVVVRTPARGRGKSPVRVETRGDQFVLALSLWGAAKVAERFLEAAPELKKTDNDFTRTIAFAEDLGSDLKRPAPKGPLQHLSGIQFYFDVPINFWRGHTQYLDSEWGLTSIAQPQFWARPREGGIDEYRGILSVDIGIWDKKYNGKLAWNCTPDEIAIGTWAQMKDHHDDAFRERFGRDSLMPEPIAYAIDANIVFDPTPIEDKTPFLVNRVSAFPKRPGRLIDDQDRRPKETSKQISYYEVYREKYVMVGTHMKTYTRLTSMEAANESARHGVNALLRAAKVACETSEIWDPEDNELPDFQWLKDLDQKRFEDGRPHILRTLSDLADVDGLTCMEGRL